MQHFTDVAATGLDVQKHAGTHDFIASTDGHYRIRTTFR
jgi:hypothetical protein